LHVHRGYGFCLENPKFVASVTNSRLEGYNDFSNTALIHASNGTDISGDPIRIEWVSTKANLFLSPARHFAAIRTRSASGSPNWDPSLLPAPWHCNLE
jgi:hypothetical protein